MQRQMRYCHGPSGVERHVEERSIGQQAVRAVYEVNKATGEDRRTELCRGVAEASDFNALWRQQARLPSLNQAALALPAGLTMAPADMSQLRYAQQQPSAITMGQQGAMQTSPLILSSGQTLSPNVTSVSAARQALPLPMSPAGEQLGANPAIPLPTSYTGAQVISPASAQAAQSSSAIAGDVTSAAPVTIAAGQGSTAVPSKAIASTAPVTIAAGQSGTIASTAPRTIAAGQSATAVSSNAILATAPASVQGCTAATGSNAISGAAAPAVPVATQGVKLASPSIPQPSTSTVQGAGPQPRMILPSSMGLTQQAAATGMSRGVPLAAARIQRASPQSQ